jgi:hypothetical protein
MKKGLSVAPWLTNNTMSPALFGSFFLRNIGTALFLGTRLFTIKRPNIIDGTALANCGYTRIFHSGISAQMANPNLKNFNHKVGLIKSNLSKMGSHVPRVV